MEGQTKVNRRSFLKKAGIGAAATAAAATAFLASCEKKEEKAVGPAVQTKKVKFNWKLVSSFGPTAPVISEFITIIADDLRTMTDGALDIKTFGAGELVPAFGVFDAVSGGSVEMFVSASYYWAGKVPATQFTCSVPFGMAAQQVNAWFFGGDGKDLWNEFYEPHNLKVFPLGSTGTQMGGWFRKEIKSVADLNGLKMRIPGLGGKVYASKGTKVILLPGPEIFPALERGVIDATEWVGPLYDFSMGLHQAAPYYYSPGWHEPSTNNELSVSLKAFNALPKDIQKMVEVVAFKANTWGLANYDARNGPFVKKLVDYGTKFRVFPDDVLIAMFKAAEKINDQVADDDKTGAARKVYDSYKKFRDQIRGWHKINEYAYTNALKTVGAI